MILVSFLTLPVFCGNHLVRSGLFVSYAAAGSCTKSTSDLKVTVKTQTVCNVGRCCRTGASLIYLPVWESNQRPGLRSGGGFLLRSQREKSREAFCAIIKETVFEFLCMLKVFIVKSPHQQELLSLLTPETLCSVGFYYEAITGNETCL